MTVEQAESEEEKEKGYVGCGRESFVVKNKDREVGEESDGEEEDVEKIVRGREPNDANNENESEDQEMKGGAQADHSSDGDGGRNREEEPISAASSGSKRNDQLTHDEAADGDENQRESKIQREIEEKEKEKQVVEGKTGVREWTQTNRCKHGREKGHKVVAKERSGKGKDRHKERRRSSFSSLPSPKKEKKKRQNKKDGLESPFSPWFQVAFEGLPFGPDVPGVSPNSTYCYSVFLPSYRHLKGADAIKLTLTLLFGFTLLMSVGVFIQFKMLGWMKKQWRLLMAEAVLILGLVYIIQATGL